MLALLLVALAGCGSEQEASPRAAVTMAGTDRPGLLGQLQSDPAVRREMIFRTQPRGLFQCGARVLGREDRELYLWLACADFSRGPDAEMLSGSSLAAVVTLDEKRNVVRVRFPRQPTLRADIRAMSPAGLQERVIAGNIAARPSWDTLLERARQAG